MPLVKQTVDMRFGQGLDLKTDPWQVQPGKFLSLVNAVFDTGGMLKKRNGFGSLTSLPGGAGALEIATLGNALVGIGSSVYAYSSTLGTWSASGSYLPLGLAVQELFYPPYSLAFVDVAVTSSGLACAVHSPYGSATFSYSVYDTKTGITLVAATELASFSYPRVFVLGNYFILLGNNLSGGGICYYYIPTNNPTATPVKVALSSNYSGNSCDGVVYNNTLYVAWDENSSAGMGLTSVSSALVQGPSITISGLTSDIVGITATSGGTLWVASHKTSTTTTKVAAYNTSLTQVLAPTTVISSKTLVFLTMLATDAAGVTLYGQVNNTYSFSPNHRSDYIASVTCSPSGTVGSVTTVLRGVGLASKAFFHNSVPYMLALYGNSTSLQPSLFLISGTGGVFSRFAYSVAKAGYYANPYFTLPSVSINGSSVVIGYLYQDLIRSVSKSNSSNGSNTYGQLGANLVTFDFNPSSINHVQAEGSLQIGGGMLWMFDGSVVTEQGFHLWAEDVTVTPYTSGGNMADGTYYYQVTYEWQDAQGLVHKSAPSVPVSVTITGSSGKGSVALNIPTLRLGSKASNVIINVYRWSSTQQTYYSLYPPDTQVNNDPTVDSIATTDGYTNSSIAGNTILYTTGGVVENIAGPAATWLTLYNARVFLVDAENGDLWYSKQLVEAAPLELSDLFTLYLPPSVGSQDTTGVITCAFPMDDKLIIFKESALYYLTGIGPDNTGANNDFPSVPTFINSTVGCKNPKSVVFMPQGLMFQSSKGFWLLGRDLSTQYVGAPVEAYNGYDCLSATALPDSNQVRFVMSDGTTLIYDYYYGQWGTFTGITPISGTLYKGLHTLLDASGNVYQETPGIYLDGVNPVLMSFKTNWVATAGIQGYQRAYAIELLGQYLSPHSLSCSLSYDYSSSPSQTTVITPSSTSSVEEWRLWVDQQQCESFQLYVQEQASTAGEGFTLSGLNLVIGAKSRYRPQSAARSSG